MSEAPAIAPFREALFESRDALATERVRAAAMDGESLVYILATGKEGTKAAALHTLLRREGCFLEFRRKAGIHLGRKARALTRSAFGNECLASLIEHCTDNPRDAAQLAMELTQVLCDPSTGASGPKNGPLHLAFQLPHHIPAAGFAAFLAAGLTESTETPGEPYRVVAGRAHHHAGVTALRVRLFGPDPADDKYVGRIICRERNRNFFFVALDKDDKVVGFVYGELFHGYTRRPATPVLNTDHMYVDQVRVNTIGVSPENRYDGIGRMLMTEAAATIRTTDAEITLEVRKSDKGARAFYEGLGMELGTVSDPSYYADAEPGVGGKRKRQTKADMAAVSYVAPLVSFDARAAARTSAPSQ